MKITIHLASLAAVAPAMADKDIRYYLNGVAVECEKKTVTLIAVNGWAMTVARHAMMSYEGAKDPKQIILPRDFVLTILKTAKNDPTVDVGVDGDALTCKIGNATFNATAIDGKFPDWRSVIPSHDAPVKDMAAFDPEVLQVALDASTAYKKRARMPFAGVHLKPAGEASTAFVLAYTDAQIMGVVMPLRDNGKENFTPNRDAVIKAVAAPL